MTVVYRVLESPCGRLTLAGDDDAIVALQWFAHPEAEAEARGWRAAPEFHPRLDQAVEQLEDYFRGRRKHFDIPVNPRGSAFQRRAWLSLATIGYGETISYQEQARRMGRPTAARAVGGANARNPISIILPCHRVVGKGGALTGYGGGLEIKQRLLELEGIRIRKGRIVRG